MGGDCFLVPILTVDQLMWRTIVHHIPRWREPSLLRDFMVRLWPFTLWNVDCLHVNWLIRCVWIAGSVVFMENNAHPVGIVDDKIPLGCKGRQTPVARMMWWTIIWDVGDDICLWMYQNRIKRVLIWGRWISHGQLFTSEPWENQRKLVTCVTDSISHKHSEYGPSLGLTFQNA